MIPTRSGGLSPGETVIRVVLEFSHAIRQILFIMSQHNGLRRLLAREVARATRKVLPSTAHAAAQRRPTFLGATVGMTLGSITATIVTWPVADILLAPWLIKECLLSAREDKDDSATDVALPLTDVVSLRQMVGSVNHGTHARVCVLTGGTREQRDAAWVEGRWVDDSV